MGMFDFFGKGLKDVTGIDLSTIPGANLIFHDDSAKKHQQMFGNLANQTLAQRPDSEQSRVNAMQQGSLAFGPLQQLMAQMYGPGAAINLSQMAQSPLSHSSPGTAAFGQQTPPQQHSPSPIQQQQQIPMLGNQMGRR